MIFNLTLFTAAAFIQVKHVNLGFLFVKDHPSESLVQLWIDIVSQLLLKLLDLFFQIDLLLFVAILTLMKPRLYRPENDKKSHWSGDEHVGH